MIFLKFLSVCFLLYSNNLYALQPWTWCFKKKFTYCSLRDGSQAFIKNDISDFSQLLFSWNALRPQKGFFRFFIKIRYSTTGLWSDWLAIAEWGHVVQKTLYSKDSYGLVNHYVRLEIPYKKCADGFQVKVEACDGADLGSIKMLACSCSNMSNFMPEGTNNKYSQLESVYITGVPMLSQMFLDHPKADALCSPVALGSLMGYMMGKPLDYLTFAEGVYDQGLKVYGSWPLNIAHAFDYSQGKIFCCVQRLHSFSVLYDYLEKKIPVVVSVKGALQGAEKNYPHGHLLLVVGYDAESGSVICHDSAVGYREKINLKDGHVPQIPTDTCKKYKLNDFLQAWEARQRIAYIVQPIQ